MTGRALMICLLVTPLLLGTPAAAQTAHEGPTVDRVYVGAYLGENPPGLEARVFAGGELVPHPLAERRSFNLAFSPDGRELFFSYNQASEEHPSPVYEIKTLKRVGDRWTGPSAAAFSGTYSDVDVNFSPDGQFLFFASDRPNRESALLDIYYVTKEGDGWSEPIYAGAEVNSMSGEVYPSASENGHLFFRSGRPGGYGSADIYRADWIDGGFTNVRNLGPNVNTEYGESDSVVSPDESYILFVSARPETGDVLHIFVSFQTGDNVWTQAESLGPAVNTAAGAGAPTLSPDGRYLFFKRRDGGERGLYWISTQVIERLRERHH